jgi:HEAT repeat protein
MSEQRARLEHWLALQPSLDPALVAAHHSALDAFEAAAGRGEVTEDQLRRLVAIASDKREWLWPSGAEYLAILSENSETVCQAVLEMSRSSKWHVRFHALFCVGIMTPAAVTERLLVAGLSDKSWRVRWRAAVTINAFERRELLPQLAAALARETHPVTRAEMERSVNLLRQGSVVTSFADGSVEVTVRADRGCLIRRHSADQVRELGLDQLIAELEATARVMRPEQIGE